MNRLSGVFCAGPIERTIAAVYSLDGGTPASSEWRVHTANGRTLATFLHPPTAALTAEIPLAQAHPYQHTADIEVTAVVRLDNRAELTGLLGLTSIEEAGCSDQDLFTAAWKKWKTGALNRIVGAFAAAIWETDQQKLTLVRDHTGDQPLFFLQKADLLAFSSLPMPLRNLEGVDTSLDEEQMLRYLALLPMGPAQTLFRNIQKLPPGHLLTFQNGVVEVVRYWHPVETPAIRYKKDDDYVEAFQSIFDLAVGARLGTSGGIGSELSGGLDSGSVTATAARLLAGARLTAFTAIPQKAFAGDSLKGRFADEGPAAARLAAMYPNISHVLVDCSAGELVNGLRDMEEQGYPVFNPLNQMWISAILDDCKVCNITALLNGTCGNATLSASGLIGLSELFSKGRWIKLARLVHLLRQRGHVGLRVAASMATAPAIPLWLQRQLAPETRNFSFAFSPLRPEIVAARHLREQRLDEMQGHLSNVEDYRRKTFDYFDPGASNAAVGLGWGVEMRDPTADKRIFEFCYSIPIEQYLAEGQTRSLVRRAMRGRVPDETLNCRDRGLQAADWYLTMGSRRQELMNELALIRLSPMANRLLDLDRLQMLLENWPTGGFETQEVIYSWHLALSRGIAAGHFIRRFE